MLDLCRENAFIFRITHIENVPWILANGLHCCNSTCRDPNFCEIGNPDLIKSRKPKQVHVPPRGVLSDYIPFYFTPHSPMMLNIKTGRNGVKMRPMSEIAILSTSLHKVSEAKADFVFTDRHAIYTAVQFSSDLEDLDWIDWPRLKKRDFKRDADDPGKFERYQAEALIHRFLPVATLLEIVCYGSKQEKRLQEEVVNLKLTTPVAARPDWYF
jgi:hypothetical protein